MTIGVLALQGDFEAHRRALAAVGLESREVRTEREVLDSTALVLPGGESTAMWKLMEETALGEAIAGVFRRGDPILATCAGAILVSREIRSPQRRGLGLLDVAIERNAYGRQLDSTILSLLDVRRDLFGDGPLEAVFIRAPRFAELGEGLEVLARRDGDPVLIRSGGVLAATFHPELSEDPRVYELFKRRLS